jgi:hypothetical protein
MLLSPLKKRSPGVRDAWALGSSRQVYSGQDISVYDARIARQPSLYSCGHASLLIHGSRAYRCLLNYRIVPVLGQHGSSFFLRYPALPFGPWLDLTCLALTSIFPPLAFDNRASLLPKRIPGSFASLSCPNLRLTIFARWVLFRRPSLAPYSSSIWSRSPPSPCSTSIRPVAPPKQLTSRGRVHLF